MAPCMNVLMQITSVLMSCTGMLISVFILLIGRAAADPLNEAQALMAFKAGITHDPFGRLQSWQLNAVNDSTFISPCKVVEGHLAAASSVPPPPPWAGIVCDNRTQHVTSVNLRNFNLSGSISPSLSLLPALSQLDVLSDNLLSGTLSNALFSPRHPIQYLNLSYNLLEGGLPDSLANLSALHTLDLSYNKFEAKMPPSLGHLRKLKVLMLENTGLSADVPEEIWQLPALRELRIIDDTLKQLHIALPESLGFCSTITDLDLQLSSVPSAQGSAIPSSLSDCRKLEFLVIDVEGLQGFIAPQIWQLPLLQALVVVDQEAMDVLDSSNRTQFNLHGSLPSNFSFCPSIEDLIIDGVNLTGEIPSSLGECTALQFLDLSHGSLQGVIPDSFQNLTNLKALHLQSNNLEGGIPASLSACSQLESLRLGDNRHLSGAIPRELGELAQLQVLSLFTVTLFGPMPDELCNCTQLAWLDMGWPVVGVGMGKLPDCISRLAHLETLGWQMNTINGVVPMKVLKNLTRLQYLDMSFTQVRGNIPHELGNLSQLQHLSFRQNNLTGPIPSVIGQLPSIELIDFSINRLSGSLPETFIHGLVNGSTILQLSLSQNRLQGVIPDSIGGLQKVQVLYLGNNEFCGTIPPTLANCTALEDLDLQRNLLEGVIPSSLGQPTGLTHSLLLASNNLSGEIPEALGALAKLQVLDLSKNKLLGPLPRSLENCSNLQILRLSENGLTGEIEHFNLTRLPQLQTFTVHQNNFTGGLPSSLTSSPQLVLFDVQKNNLSGSFGSETADIMMGLLNLRVLVMSYNNLSGTLPGWLWKLPMLQVLDLSNNHFSGIMPTDVSSLAYFKTDQMQSKNQSILYEEVPQTIKFTYQVLSYILNTKVFFDVSRKHLEGEIAESFGQLLGLTGLNLSHNRIQGRIPKSLGNLVDLDLLDLSHNSLTGAIPQELGNIGGLSVVDLSYNNLEGHIPNTNFFNTRFGGDRFAHNPLLCGVPLVKNCSSGQQGSVDHNSSSTNLGAEPAQNLARRIVEKIESFISLWGLLIGYAVGLLGVLYLRHCV